MKAIRFATERMGGSGIVRFVNNNSSVTENTFDGMRKGTAKDFDEISVLALGGIVRKNSKLSGTTHNVFGIQVGVSIIQERSDERTNMNTKVYVDNLAAATTEKDLTDLFSAYGNVMEVNIAVARANHKPRGFGFVSMATPEGARSAILALNGKAIGTCTLIVSEAWP